jgi:hypothetical protein
MHELRPFAVPPLVITSCFVADRAGGRRSIFPVAMALSRLPAVTLAHGTRPETRLDDGTALLAQFRTRLPTRRLSTSGPHTHSQKHGQSARH